MDQAPKDWSPHSSHWGAFSVRWSGATPAIRLYERNPAPYRSAEFHHGDRHKARVLRPMVRTAWLDRPGSRRRRNFDQPFVALSWDEALDRFTDELSPGLIPSMARRGVRRVVRLGERRPFPPRAEPAPSLPEPARRLCPLGQQLQRRRRGGDPAARPRPARRGRRQQRRWDASRSTPSWWWPSAACREEHDVGGGGISRHIARAATARRAAQRGVRVRRCSARCATTCRRRSQAPWHPILPGTDVALMLGLAHTLVERGAARRRLPRTLLPRRRPCSSTMCSAAATAAEGRRVGGAISGIAGRRRSAPWRARWRRRTLVTVLAFAAARASTASSRCGWASLLAALLGQIGLPGGGFGHGSGSIGDTGKPPLAVPLPTLPQGRNGSAISSRWRGSPTCCCSPGEPFDYDGQRLTYPDIRLVYWAGGNPFHHHQDLNRLRRAFARPDTLDRARAVLDARRRATPTSCCRRRCRWSATTSAPPPATALVAMHRAVAPVGEARNDYDIFAALAAAPRRRARRSPKAATRAWLAHLYEPTRRALADARLPTRPTSTNSGKRGDSLLPIRDEDGGIVARFRADPEAHRCRRRAARSSCSPRPSPASATTTARGTRPGCRRADAARLRATRCTLIANQPATRLHSQLDFGAYSQADEGRRPRAGAPPPGRCGGARHRRRRHRAPVQRSRRLPRRRGR